MSAARPLSNATAIRRHVRHKLGAGELPADVANRMLASVDAGALDYPAILQEARWPTPPPLVFHTAPPSAHESILERGLRPCQPGTGGNWSPRGEWCELIQGGQPVGVYVGIEPDWRGMWSHWQEWDIWVVERADLPYVIDPINPGCYVLTAEVPSSHLTFLETTTTWT